MELQGLEGLRGRGALKLNSQPCDETKREVHDRDGVRILSEQRESQRLSYGRENGRSKVAVVIVVVYLTLTDSLRIQSRS